MEGSASALASGTTAPLPFNLDAAHDLLAAFDVADDPESRAFLADLLASGTVPPEEVELLSGINPDERKKTSRRRGKARSASIAASEPESESSVSLESPSPAPSPRKRQRKREPRKAKQKRDETKTSVSPFFADDGPSPDESDGEETKTHSNVKSKRTPDLPPPASTKTVVIYTKKAVLSGNGKQPPQTTETLELSKQTVLTTPTKARRQISQISSPTKTLLNSEPGSPSSSGYFSCGPSPSKSTPKQKRGTTSYFFTPPSSHHGRRRKDDDSSCSDDDTSDSDSSSPTPVPSIKGKKKKEADRPRRGTVSALPFPRLDAPHFGLVQEQLSTDPFWLMIALVFLTRVAGRVSLPVFWALRERYPSPKALVDADPHELMAMFRHLGMATVRCAAIQRHARGWLQRPPQPGVCTTVRNYPTPPEADDKKEGTIAKGLGSQWEIGHLTQGAYAVDSWRIFCRDGLLGRSTDWKGDDGGSIAGRRLVSSSEDSSSFDSDSDWEAPQKHRLRPRSDEPFQPEWMRVLPRDKELRACLRWMWMREGWDWDPRTGDRKLLSEELRDAVDEGRVGYDKKGRLQIIEGDLVKTEKKKKERLEVVL